MVQYEYRNYLPHLGRWMTRDPLGEAGGLNLYAFVGNNPVNWVDPWGFAVATNSIDGAINACLESPNPQTRIDCLKELLEQAIDNPKQTQRAYQAINKEYRQMVKFTKEMNSTSRKIADGGQIDKVNKLVDRFGGKIKDWSKKACKDANGKEWHWYENKSIGKVGVKPKGTPDPWYLQ